MWAHWPTRGWPMVDMTRQMHNETHRIAPQQPVAAPVNHFHRREALVTPSTSGELRAPNNDTLYFSGWFDLSAEPVIVQVPDTADRYYTLAVTDFFNEVTHLGRRTTGTRARVFALVGPGWTGELPPGVTAVPLATSQVWILGRMLVDGERDFPVALDLVRRIGSAPLSQWRRDAAPAVLPDVPSLPAGQRLDPMGSLEFFAVLNRWLRVNAARPDEGALLGLFDQIGVGPRSVFSAAALDAATRRGLERAIADGQALLKASAQRPLKDVRNGWIFPLALADYGHDYLSRAGVAFGGYANRPEETVYVARTVDDAGRLMTGARRYRLYFPPGGLPPVGAFWSISAYDLRTLALIDNPLRRYSLGDRTPGLRLQADGSLDLRIQKDPPAEGLANWLPVGEGAYLLVVRLYEPQAAVFDGRYKLPPLLED
ncbi:MAG: DUF1254 domain-containing protein [Ideonella sp.]|nr:DUF1254 domain-containing protein [Ideonella sp.]